MDPLTATTTFATIVGLVCNFKQEHAGNRDADHRLFIDWLLVHKHDQLASQLQETRELTVEIDKLLRADHDAVMHALSKLSRQIAQVASSMNEFSGIISALPPSEKLSDQAIGILRRLLESNAHEIIYFGATSSTAPSIQLKNGIDEELSEPRFLEDDLFCLVSQGLLSHRPGRGLEVYKITRAGASYLNELKRDR